MSHQFRLIVSAVLTSLVAICNATSIGCRAFGPRELPPPPPTEHHRQVDIFEIHSNSPFDDADPIAGQLIDLRAAVQSVLNLPAPARPIDIYIFDDRQQYERFIETSYPGLPRRRAFFMARGDRGTVYAFRDSKLIEDLRHESCHALLHGSVGAVPLWLDEGLAEYFETPGSAAGMHARHLTELKRAIRTGWRPSLTRLEGLTELQQMTAEDYREAWSWAYWLIHSSPESHELLIEYLQEVRQGGAREPLSTRIFARSTRPDSALVGMFAQLQID